MRTIYSVLRKSAAIFLFGSLAAVSAASISLNPVEQSVQVGQEATIQINMDFSGDPTIGGGIDILFDDFTNGTELTFVSYEAADIGDPGLRRDPDVESDKLNSIGITAFDGLPEQALVGTIKFIANDVGEYTLTPTESTGVAGGFFALVDTGQPVVEQNPDLFGATITVVPLPAALWLLGVGLFGLVTTTRVSRQQ